MKEANFEMAERAVKIVGFDAESSRVNKLRQLGVERGQAVCHRAEVERGEARKDGCGQAEGFTMERRIRMRNTLRAINTNTNLCKGQAEYQDRVARQEPEF